MDKGTAIGLALAMFSILGAAVVESGKITALFGLLNLPSALIVFGGTIGTVIVAFPLERVMTIPKVMGVAFRQVNISDKALVSLFVKLSERARREGLLALEGEAQTIEDKSIQKGVLLVVDGTDPDLVREIMEADVAAMSERHEGKFAMLAAAGGFAPTMGIIGTVLGLINVLSNLGNAEELGKSIATAFIATLYGILTANVFWLPLGERLKQRNKEEVAHRTLAVEGVLAVQAGDNPRVVREKLEAFLPLTERGEEGADEAVEGAAPATPAAAA